MNSVYSDFIINLFNISIKGILILVSALLLSVSKNKISAQIKKQVLLISFVWLFTLFIFTYLQHNVNFLNIKSSHSIIDMNRLNQSGVTYQSERILSQMSDTPSAKKNTYEQVSSKGDFIISFLKNWKVYAFSLWLLGFLWGVISLFIGILGTSRLKKNAISLNETHYIEYLSIKKVLNIRQSVQVLFHEGNFSPLTFGFVKPVIILPKDSINWSKERINIALLHELIHIKKADFMKNIFIKIVCLIFWFNPFVWITAKQYRFLQEAACDEQVVNNGIKPQIYAKEILELTRICNSLVLANSIIGPKRTNTEKRIMSILSVSKSKQILKRWYIFCGILMTVSIIILTSSFNFVSSEEQISNEIPSLWPLQEGKQEISTYFGEYLYKGADNKTVVNHGVNILWSGNRVNIYASADGIVDEVGTDEYGDTYISIKHKYDLVTYYGYLCNSFITEGSYVKKGDIIGESTKPGIIHFEIRKGNKVIDPLLMMEKLPSSY